MREETGKKFTCRDCGKKVAIVIPYRGDGTGFRLRKHRIGQDICSGTYRDYHGKDWDNVEQEVR